MLENKSLAESRNKFFAFLLFLVFIFGFFTYLEIKNSETFIPKEDCELVLFQENSLVAISNPVYIPLNSDLRVFYEKDKINYEQAILLNKIIECESNWQNVCNVEGCEKGQGVSQLIPSTVKYCEEKLNKTIDAFNVNKNIECAIWLLQNEGWEHWGTELTAGKWGSYECFKDLIH